MHSNLLDDALLDFAEDASEVLQAELAAGAEIPFELASTGGRRRGGGGELYMYRSLTGRFVRESWALLSRLESCEEALRALEACHGLDRYVASRGGDVHVATSGSRGSASAALRAFTEDLFHEQSDFELHRERFAEALRRLDAAAAAEGASLSLIATLHGVAITSPELAVAQGLTIARPETIADLPEELRWEAQPRSARPGNKDESEERLIVLYSAGERDESPVAAISHGKAVLGDLLRGLRLFGDGRVAFGPLAWVRIDGGPAQAVALGGMGRRSRRALLVTPSQEDELRAFCSLVARRVPVGDRLAWALRRFELGCERPGAYEALSDHLLALQALLDPERGAHGLLAARVAALCAPAEQRQQTSERVMEAIALERAAVEGEAVEHAAGFELAHELAGWLKALLSDVICGHLDRDLERLADELLLADGTTDAVEHADGTSAHSASADRASSEGEAIDVDPDEDEDAPSEEQTRIHRRQRTRRTGPAPVAGSRVREVDDPLDSLAQGILPL